MRHETPTSQQVRRFIAECCTLGPERLVASTELLAAYNAWCERVGEVTHCGATFNTMLRRLGYPVVRGGKGAMFFRSGLRLNEAPVSGFRTRSVSGRVDSTGPRVAEILTERLGKPVRSRG